MSWGHSHLREAYGMGAQPPQRSLRHGGTATAQRSLPPHMLLHALHKSVDIILTATADSQRSDSEVEGCQPVKEVGILGLARFDALRHRIHAGCQPVIEGIQGYAPDVRLLELRRGEVPLAFHLRELRLRARLRLDCKTMK